MSEINNVQVSLDQRDITPASIERCTWPDAVCAVDWPEQQC